MGGGRVSLALVYFPQEKRSYVLDVCNVLDFNPKSVNDFDSDHLYDVNWSVLQRQDSDTTEVAYKGYIRCLAVNAASMVQRAASSKFKLPQSFLNTVEPKEKKAPMVSSKTSKLARKQVNLALEKASKLRMQKMIKIHSEVVAAVQSKKTESSSNEALPSSVPYSEPIKQLPLKEGGCPAGAPSPMQSSEVMAPVQQHPQTLSKGTNEAQQEIVTTRLRKRKRGLANDDATTVVSDCSYISSKHEMEALQDKVVRLQGVITSQNKKLRLAEVEIESLKTVIENWEAAFSNFQKSVLSSTSTVGPGVSDAGKSKAQDERPSLGLSTVNKEDIVANWTETSFSTKKTSVRRDLFGINSLPEHESSAIDASPSKDHVSQRHQSHGFSSPWKVSSQMDTDLNTNADEGSKTTQGLDNDKGGKESSCTETILTHGHEETQNEPTSCTVQERKVGEVVSSSAAAISPKSKKAAKKKKLVTPALRDGEKFGKELAKMIFMDLKGEQPLQENGNNQVHIGNNCWIQKEFFNDKVKNGKKLSIILKDLAEEIWGYKKCSKMSLTGGFGVKDPTAPCKIAAPAHEREAIYGVFRGKLMTQGLTSEEHLDRAEKSEAQKYLREKFQDSDKKIKAAYKAAAQKASKEITETE